MTIPRFTTRHEQGPRVIRPPLLPPVAAFIWDGTGLTIEFQSQSYDLDGQVVDYSWDFGDQGTIGGPPTAAFSASPNGLVIAFTDLSTDVAPGVIVSRLWTFGDGGTSTAANPSHTYAQGGAYNVSLKVTDDDGNQSTTTQSVVTVSGDGLGLAVFSFFISPNRANTIGAASVAGDVGGCSPGSIITQINFCRANGYLMFPNFAGGSSAQYATDGNFDIDKWKTAFNQTNSPAIKQAVAGAVADGILPGISLMDEPMNQRWGNTFLTNGKAKLDQMAAHVHSIFPTCPCGPTLQWFHADDMPGTFAEVDFIVSQYTAGKPPGTVAGYRTGAAATATANGIRVVFSINILDGGNAGATCGNDTGGNGTRPGLCRVTAAQLETWGLYLGETTRGGLLTLWRYDPTFFGRADNQTALAAVATYLAGRPRASLRRA